MSTYGLTSQQMEKYRRFASFPVPFRPHAVTSNLHQNCHRTGFFRLSSVLILSCSFGYTLLGVEGAEEKETFAANDHP